MNIYNDNDPKVCAWASELVRQGHVAPGSVLCKSIKEVQADELRQATQVHLFAGILGWPLALRLAGWPDDWPVWTGSCPCQSESVAGKRLGTEDPRHLWPDMLRLICECRPSTIFGEQVARAARTGWIDRVRTDLEAEGYAFGFHVLGAHSVGGLHQRQRIYWCADTGGVRPQGIRPAEKEPWSWEQLEGLVQAALRVSVPTGASGGLADGVLARVVRLRGYGNAIVPQVAAAFVRAFMESRTEAA